MSLEKEIRRSAREISTDGYEMSIGELISLYKDQELIVNPEFQRYFRWDISQKTKFIESILLGIPIPAIFVFQTVEGTWELVDGLQRLSTIFEFVGILRKEDGLYPPSVLEGTKLLPSLSGKRWGDGNGAMPDSLDRSQQLEIRRARMRVEILKKESDVQSKYELFQRLNTGGSLLSQQEIRNVVMLMVNKDFFNWVMRLSNVESFTNTVIQTEDAEKKQRHVELVVRFVVCRNIPYGGGLDVHEYLDDGVIKLASDTNLDYEAEQETFIKTFDLLNNAMGDETFKRYDGTRFLGQFLISAYEAIAIGVSKNVEALQQLDSEARSAFVKRKVRELWNDPNFRRNSGAGVRGTTRLANLLPMGMDFFRP